MPTPDSSDPRLRLATVYEVEESDLDASALDDHPPILLRTDPEDDELRAAAREDDDDDDHQDLPPVTPVGAEDLFFLDLSPNERPTIPVPPPRDSGIRLTVTRVPIVAATVDAVVCDLSRDPRSETWSGDERARPEAGGRSEPSQKERPPSTSIVRALK